MSEINKISKLVTSKLKSLEIPKEQLDWSRIKKTPQLLKQKINLNGGSYTVDEQFNTLETKLNYNNTLCKQLLKHLQSYATLTEDIISLSISIAECFQNTIDPYSNIKDEQERKNDDTLDSAFNLWLQVTNYKNCINSIGVIGELKSLQTTTCEKLEDLNKILRSVYKNINMRHVKLLDYDKIYNEYELLLVKKDQGETLTIKQSNQFYSLERKLDSYKEKYDQINDLLKREMPVLLEFVGQIIELLQLKLYFASLIYYYHTTTCLKRDSGSIDGIETRVNDTKSARIFEVIDSSSLISAPRTTKAHSETCTALHNYMNSESTHLRFHKGNKINILERISKDWWKGELGGQSGMFPSSYVKIDNT